MAHVKPASQQMLLERLEETRRKHAAFVEQYMHDLMYPQVVTVEGETMAVSSTPEGIVKFQQLYDKVATEFRAMGMSVNSLERMNVLTFSSKEIEERQRKALDYLKTLWDKRYPPMPNDIGIGAVIPRNGVAGAMAPRTGAGSAPERGPKVEEKRRLSEEEAYRLLGLRLRLREGTIMPLKMNIILGEDKTYLFTLSKGGPVVLEDDPHLFPSDEMIAKLILLME